MMPFLFFDKSPVIISFPQLLLSYSMKRELGFPLFLVLVCSVFFFVKTLRCLVVVVAVVFCLFVTFKPMLFVFIPLLEYKT